MAAVSAILVCDAAFGDCGPSLLSKFAKVLKCNSNDYDQLLEDSRRYEPSSRNLSPAHQYRKSTGHCWYSPSLKTAVYFPTKIKQKYFMSLLKLSSTGPVCFTSYVINQASVHSHLTEMFILVNRPLFKINQHLFSARQKL